MNTLRGKDFLSIMDLSKAELEYLIDEALTLKGMLDRGERHELLYGKTLGMIFANPSTRTRVSFETGMTQLGGHAQFYTTSDMQTAHKETWVDTAKVLSRYLNGLLIRIYDLPKLGMGREVVRTVAENATIPVINALDDYEHPCQCLADLITMKEKFGEDFKKKKVVMSWAYSERFKPAGVPQAMVAAAGLLGMNLTLAYPKGYDLDKEYMDFFDKESKRSGAKLEITHDLNDAAEDAIVIYAKSWGSYSMEREYDLEYRKQFKDSWCVNDKHFELADPNAIFMHCLPADRNQEVTDSVMDGPHSAVYDEAENRMHAHKAICVALMSNKN
ncbi:MAG: ornithine carbamoyltransferase [Clostridiaceae bacterium]|jgi:ornithine carbamoyltransferase|nr:ornithine carbamoyltransferase [Clostridiaceae bacterium]